MAHGLDPARVSRQIREIDRLNAKLKGFTILKGIEVDILKDGSLDLPDSTLAQLDVVVAAVHSFFDLPARGANRACHPRNAKSSCLNHRPSHRPFDRRARALRRSTWIG